MARAMGCLGVGAVGDALAPERVGRFLENLGGGIAELGNRIVDVVDLHGTFSKRRPDPTSMLISCSGRPP